MIVINLVPIIDTGVYNTLKFLCEVPFGTEIDGRPDIWKNHDLLHVDPKMCYFSYEYGPAVFAMGNWINMPSLLFPSGKRKLLVSMEIVSQVLTLVNKNLKYNEEALFNRINTAVSTCMSVNINRYHNGFIDNIQTDTFIFCFNVAKHHNFINEDMHFYRSPTNLLTLNMDIIQMKSHSRISHQLMILSKLGSLMPTAMITFLVSLVSLYLLRLMGPVIPNLICRIHKVCWTAFVTGFCVKFRNQILKFVQLFANSLKNG